MFNEPDALTSNKLQESQKYLLIVFHFFGLHPLFERKSANLSRVSNYIPTLVVLACTVILIGFNIVEFFEKTWSIASVIKIWHSILWNAITASILVRTLLDPLKLVELLELMYNVDEILLTRLKYETNYKKLRRTVALKLALISAIYVVLFLPYYVHNYELYSLTILCFEIASDSYCTVLLAFFLFYFGLLNDRVKIVFDHIQMMIENIKAKGRNKHEKNLDLLADLTTLNDLYGKLWTITLTINENFGSYLISFIIFTFIDMVGLTFFLCKQLQEPDIAPSITILCLIIGIIYHLLIITVMTNDLKENASGIGNSVHFFDANDSDFVLLMKDFSSHVLFQPICIESIFFQFDLELLVPVSYLMFLPNLSLTSFHS